MLKGNFKMTEIPYRGSAPAINDLLAGTIDMVPDYLLANKQNIDVGKIKLLATGSHERLKDYPKVATIAETLPGVYADTWMAVAAPPKTPREHHPESIGRDRAGLPPAGPARAHPGARSRAARHHAGRDARSHQAEPRDLGPGGRGGPYHAWTEVGLSSPRFSTREAGELACRGGDEGGPSSMKRSDARVACGCGFVRNGFAAAICRAHLTVAPSLVHAVLVGAHLDQRRLPDAGRGRRLAALRPDQRSARSRPHRPRPVHSRRHVRHRDRPDSPTASTGAPSPAPAR